MALIKCSECQREISDKATSCPHCGYPLNKIEMQENENYEIDDANSLGLKNLIDKFDKSDNKIEGSSKNSTNNNISNKNFPFIRVIIIFCGLTIIIFALIFNNNQNEIISTMANSSYENIQPTKSESQIKEEQIKAQEEAKKIAQEKADRQVKINSFLSKMRIETDDVKDIKWIYDTSSPMYINVNAIFIYISALKDNSNPTLRMKIQYTGENWLFINSYSLKVDDKLYTITPSYGEVERDNKTTVWEWYDFIPNNSQISIIREIIKSNKTILRYEGDIYNKDKEITQTEKNAMNNILQLYDLMVKQ